MHPHISHLVYFISHRLSLNHLYPHQVFIHPISNTYMFFVLVCAHLYIVGAGLACHQTSCTAHKQSLVFKVSMLLVLLSFPLSVWTWIASLDIDVFHLGLPCPHSYYHILYAFQVDIQHVLHIPLA